MKFTENNAVIRKMAVRHTLNELLGLGQITNKQGNGSIKDNAPLQVKNTIHKLDNSIIEVLKRHFVLETADDPFLGDKLLYALSGEMLQVVDAIVNLIVDSDIFYITLQ